MSRRDVGYPFQPMVFGGSRRRAAGLRQPAAAIASPRVTGATVGVDSYEGTVTLRGSVTDMDEKTAAEEIAGNHSGVKEVKNEIICCRS